MTMADHPTIRVTVLGSGTSAGVPMIGCHCPVCSSTDPRDKRTRPSIVVEYGGHSVLIDTSPELRLQSVANGIDRIDAVVYTHAHADHIFGLDDVRRFNTILNGPLPVYAQVEHMRTIQNAFPYAFNRVPQDLALGMYRPELAPTLIEGPFEIGGQEWIPVPMIHGRFEVLGFRIGNFAYCTDCHTIPDRSLAMLEGLDTLIIDGLRPRPHPTHLSFAEAQEMIAKIAPKRAYFTHIAHDKKHADIDADLPPHIRAAYDGLKINVS